MPKLPDIKYSEKGKTGEVVAFTSSIYVTTDGIFYMGIPGYLVETAISLFLPIDTNRGTWKLYAESLSRCEEMVRKTIKEYLSCTTERSLVIIYAFVSTCHFAKNNAGEIFTNGSFCPNDFSWFGNKRLSNSEDYVLGFRAKVSVKLIHRRAASEKVEYEPLRSNCDDSDKLGDWGQLLNGFTNTNFRDAVQEMSYTEEMAKVLYEAMMGLCVLSDKLSQIFSDPEKLLSIPNTLMLGAGDKAADE